MDNDQKSNPEPKLIVTTDIGKEKALADEVLNLLYPIDPIVEVAIYQRKGFIIVKGGKDPDFLASRILKFSAYAKRVIPIHIVTKASYEHVKKAAYELMIKKVRKFPTTFYISCRKRGAYIDSCKNLERYVGEFIEKCGLGEADFHNPAVILTIEIVEDRAFLSLKM